MSSEELAALEGDYRSCELFSDRDISIVAWVEAVADNSARRNTTAFEDVRRHLSEPELVELTVLVAVRTLANRVQEALWTDLEGPDFPPNRRTEMSEAVLLFHCEVVSHHLQTQLDRNASFPSP